MTNGRLGRRLAQVARRAVERFDARCRRAATRLRPVAARVMVHADAFMNPHPVAAALLVVASAAAVAWILAGGQGSNPLAIPVYVVACYAIALLVKGGIWAAARVRSELLGHELSRRYVTDLEFRTGIEVHVLLVVDGVYGMFLMAEGVVLGSFWFGATGAYYLILTVLHLVLVRSLYTPRALQKRFADGGAAGGDRAGGCGERLRGVAERVGAAMSFPGVVDELGGDAAALAPAAFNRELRAFRLCAVLLLVLDVAFTGVVAQMVKDGRGSAYPGYLIYVAAMFAFYSITVAIMNLVRSRKFERPMVWATKALDLSTGLVSILSLQTAMFASFSEGQVAFERTMNGITGLFVCLAIAAIAVVMLVKARELKQAR